MAINSVTLALGRRDGDGAGLRDGVRVGDEVGYNQVQHRSKYGSARKKGYTQIVFLA